MIYILPKSAENWGPFAAELLNEVCWKSELKLASLLVGV